MQKILTKEDTRKRTVRDLLSRIDENEDGALASSEAIEHRVNLRAVQEENKQG